MADLDAVGVLERFFDDLAKHGVLVLAVEWRDADEHLVSGDSGLHENAERPPVGLFAVSFLRDDLRRHILRCADDGVRFGVGAGEFLGDTEVSELEVAVGVEQDVFGFEVAVDDVHLVEVLEREEDLGSVELGAW